MIQNIRLYGQFLRIAILGKIQYKADFLVGMISILVLNAVNISLIGILVYNFTTINGWGIWDLMFLYSFWMLARGIFGVFFWHLSDLEELIVSGNFDGYLTRPLSPFLQLLGKDVNYTGVGDLLVGILGFVLVKNQLNLSWSIGYWSYLVICVLSGTLIQVAINWIGASLCFWTTRSGAALGIAERFTVLMQQYPVSIFGRYFQIFVTCFLPVAFINYYPSMILLGKTGKEIQVWQYFSPLVSVLLLCISAFIWTRGVKRYSGTGN
jgi:ABC-2 type transport system permease protein